MKIFKTFLVISTVILTQFLMQGCKLKEEGEKLGNDIKDSFQNIIDETDKIGENVTEKQTEAKEAIDTLNETIKKAEETKEALKDIL